MRYLLLILVLLVSLPTYAQVKKSTSGICHPPESPYYERTKRYVSYSTVKACLDSGGRLPKGTRAPATLFPGKENVSSVYSRDHFGRGWADVDGDCQNSRHETLIDQSTATVRYKDKTECQVIFGRWISVFTNEVTHDPRKIDIDHVVPLKWAWDHGASVWGETKRMQFANDPANLISVEASLNRQKGAKGIDLWLPPANRCTYVSRFIRVINRYGLALSEEESRTYRKIRNKVCK